MALVSFLAALPACMPLQPHETSSLLCPSVSCWAVSHHGAILSLQQQSLPRPPAAFAELFGAFSPPNRAGKHVPARRSPPRIAHLSAQHPPPPCQGGS